MAISHQQSLANFNNAGGVTVTRAVTPGAINDLMIVAGLTNNGGALSIADTAGNQWFTANPLLTNVNDRSQSWYSFANGTGAITITVTTTVSSTFRSLLLGVFRDTHLISPIDALDTAIGTGTPITDSFAPTIDNCMVWAWCFDSVTAVGNIGGSAATKGADDTQSDWAEYRLLSGGAGVGITAAFTGSGVYSVGAACIKPPSTIVPVIQPVYGRFSKFRMRR